MAIHSDSEVDTDEIHDQILDMRLQTFGFLRWMSALLVLALGVHMFTNIMRLTENMSTLGRWVTVVLVFGFLIGIGGSMVRAMHLLLKASIEDDLRNRRKRREERAIEKARALHRLAEVELYEGLAAGFRQRRDSIYAGELEQIRKDLQ